MTLPPGSSRGGSGTRYSYAQLEGLWINAGGSRATAPLAAAIAEAESSGWSAATSGNPDGGTNVGLWQLDTPGGKGAGYSVAQLSNPATNARVAVQGSSNGRDWSAWSTYTSGAYKAFMKSSTTPNTNVPGSGSGGGGSWANSSPGGGPTSACLWSIGGTQGIPVPFGHIGPFCILSRSQVRAWAGVGLMVVGGLGVLVFGSMLASAFGVNPGGAIGRAAGGIAEKVGAGVTLIPGAEPAGLAMVAGGHEVRQHGATKAAQQAAVRRARSRQAAAAREDREAERRLGQPRHNPELRTGRGAVRESGAGTRERAAARRSASRPARASVVGSGGPASRAEAGF